MLLLGNRNKHFTYEFFTVWLLLVLLNLEMRICFHTHIYFRMSITSIRQCLVGVLQTPKILFRKVESYAKGIVNAHMYITM